MVAVAILKNQKIAISRSQFQRFQRNLTVWRSSALVTVWSITNMKFKEPKLFLFLLHTKTFMSYLV